MSAEDNPARERMKLTEDAGGLGPRQLGASSIGWVEMIVGEGGVEVPGFVATKNEILQLVAYWANEIIELDFDFFLYDCTGSAEWRTNEFANRRLATIAGFIGEEQVTRAFRQAEEAFGKRVDQRAWNIFMRGTDDEKQRFQQELRGEMTRDRKETEYH